MPHSREDVARILNYHRRRVLRRWYFIGWCVFILMWRGARSGWFGQAIADLLTPYRDFWRDAFSMWLPTLVAPALLLLVLERVYARFWSYEDPRPDAEAVNPR